MIDIIIQAEKGYKNFKTKKYHYFASNCDFINLNSSNVLYLCLTFLCGCLSINKFIIVLSTSYNFCQLHSYRDRNNRYFLNLVISLTIIITKK